MSGKKVQEKPINLKMYVSKARTKVETILRIAQPQLDCIGMVGNRLIEKLGGGECSLHSMAVDIKKLFGHLYDFIPVAQALLGWQKTLRQDIGYLVGCIKNASPSTFSSVNSPAVSYKDNLVECLEKVNVFLNGFGNSFSIFLSNCAAKKDLLDRVKGELSIEAQEMISQMMLEESVKPGLFSDTSAMAEWVVRLYEGQRSLQDKSESKCAIN